MGCVCIFNYLVVIVMSGFLCCDLLVAYYMVGCASSLGLPMELNMCSPTTLKGQKSYTSDLGAAICCKLKYLTTEKIKGPFASLHFWWWLSRRKTDPYEHYEHYEHYKHY